MSSLASFKRKEDLPWQTLHAFFRSCGFVKHHLDSFAYCLQTTIPETIAETVEFKYETENYAYSQQFGNAYMHKPGVVENDGTVSEMFPNEARLRNLTYASPLFAQIHKSFTKKLTKETVESTETVFCGLIPTMVRSIQCRLFRAPEDEIVRAKECVYDQGGYFIVNGTEKILVGMERMCTNQVYVFPNKHDPSDIYAEISSIEERAKKAPSQFYIHLLPASSMGKKSLRAHCNYFKKEFAVGILFKALGLCEGIKDLVFKHHLFKDVTGLQRRELEVLVDSIEEESYHIQDQEQAFAYLTKIATTQGSTEDKAETYIAAVLQKEFLPHIGIDETAYGKKITFVAYMIQKLLQVHYGVRDFDDHDHEKNKRIDESGVLFGNIFKQAWSRLNRELQIMVKRKLEGSAALKELTLSQLVNNLGLSKDLSSCIATGNWSVMRNSKMKTGVSQVLNCFNYQAKLSHCRRNINPMPKNSVLSKPRQIHNSMWGTSCLWESPEGPAIGLVKNKALTCHVSIAFSDRFLTEVLGQQGLSEELSEETPYTVFLNGKIMGWGSDNQVYRLVRGLKLDATLPMDAGVVCQERSKEIGIFTDSGRKCRPVFVVTNNTLGVNKAYIDMVIAGTKTWNDMIYDGIIEIIDAGEQENLLICSKPEKLGKDGVAYTHCEISDSVIAGVCASIIPYANSDPSARIAYQGSMSKQALSVPNTNYLHRMETMTHVLHYPQKPICQNDSMDDMHYNDLPAGFDAVVAISTYYGGNQEDAIIASQRAIDLGMGRSTYYRGYKEIESKTVGAEEYFGRPDEPDAQRLDADGVIPVGVRVKEGDMIIGKLSNSIGTDGAPMKPRCTFIKHGEHGIVDAVTLSTNPGGTRSVKVRIRQERIPEVGDKFAAPHSQKGVFQGIMRPEDLPFTASGIIPDFIINPSSQPSRMTLGHMKEIRSGKYGAASGTFPNTTMFHDKEGDMEDIANGLAELGYQRMGWERMINGTTGEYMDALLYVGICYYQRLKHMVQDKIHARGSKGPIASLTRQPSEGNQIPYTHVIITVMVCVIIQ